MTRLARVFVFLLVLPALAFAQTVDGVWHGATGNGTRLILELKVEGERLSGTLTRGNETTAIADGTVVKNTIRFNATLGGQTESFTAELVGEQLIGYLDRMGPEASIAFERPK